MRSGNNRQMIERRDTRRMCINRERVRALTRKRTGQAADYLPPAARGWGVRRARRDSRLGREPVEVLLLAPGQTTDSRHFSRERVPPEPKMIRRSPEER